MAYVNLGQVMYPVGAYFFSNSSTSPSSLFGGTWAAVDAGRFICGAGSGYSAGQQGGASTVTLSTAQMPAHSHQLNGYKNGSGSGAEQGAHLCESKDFNYGWKSVTSTVGSTQAHENRPLYRAAYIWRRTG